MNPLRCLLPLLGLVLAAVLPAQRGGDRPEDSVELDRARRELLRQEAAQGEKGEKVDSEEDARRQKEEFEKLTPEERLARNIINGASAHCRFHTSFRPAKLMPGQTGTMLVTMTFHGSTVLPAPPAIEMISGPRHGPLTLGALAVRPAELGRLASGYLGRPVYDNFAVFEIPVTLTGEAPIGSRQPVSVELKFDLYDGVSAQPIGRFVDRAIGEVEVGQQPAPKVALPTRSGISAAAPVRPEPVATIPGSAAAPVKANGPAALTGRVGEVANEQPVGPAATESSGSLPLPVAVEEGLPLLPILGGAVLLLGVVILLVKKR
ncbi:MAG: hypothetical protein JNL12_16415 [Planctomycetes bacterium]|nr:hypothetical protein [Planctomycetota bacterium]